MIFSFPDDVYDYYIEQGIKKSILKLSAETEESLSQRFREIDLVREANTMRVLKAYRDVGLSESHFSGTTGYGYDDTGRDKIEKAFAMVFGADKAIVRSQISSGTQAIAAVLFGILRPGDTILSVTGMPYDTLTQTIGADDNNDMGSLKDFGISFKKIDFDKSGEIDYENISSHIDKTTKMVYVQKSKGYSERRSLRIPDIKKITEIVKKINGDIIVFVDNCYGEFVETREPCHAGADICAGSLIKNPGGGICLTGGYIAGKADLVEKAASRLSAPGVGSHTGPSLGMNRMISQGLYLAPDTVSKSLKGAVFAAGLFERCGFDVNPRSGDLRGDIVQALTFERQRELIEFCQSIQSSSPVDSFVNLIPWDMPGYSHKVIMAAGNFVQGSSSELSCDAPMKSPFTAYMQGGIVYEQIKYASMLAASGMSKVV